MIIQPLDNKELATYHLLALSFWKTNYPAPIIKVLLSPK